MRAVISVLILFLMACDSSEEVAKERVSKDSSTPEHIRRIEADDPNDIAVQLYRRCNFDGRKYDERLAKTLRDSRTPETIVWQMLSDLSLEGGALSTFWLEKIWKKDGLSESEFIAVVSAMEQAGLVSKEGSVLKRTSVGEECFNSLHSTFGEMYHVLSMFRLEEKRAAERRQKVAKERQLKDPSTPEHIKVLEVDDPNDIAVLLYRKCNFDGRKYGEYFAKTPQERPGELSRLRHGAPEMIVWETLMDLSLSEGGYTEFSLLANIWKQDGLPESEFTAMVSVMEQAGLASKDGLVLRQTSAGEECFNSLRRALGEINTILLGVTRKLHIEQHKRLKTEDAKQRNK